MEPLTGALNPESGNFMSKSPHSLADSVAHAMQSAPGGPVAHMRVSWREGNG